MTFKKGQIPHNKGKHLSEESKRKISLLKRGKPSWNKGKRGEESHWFGRNHTEDSKNKMRLHQIGRKHKEETKLKIGKSQIGKKLSKETKLKQSNSLKLAYKEGRKKISKNFSHKGFEHSDETKKKLKEATTKYIREVCNYLHPMIGHNEKQILDKLENELDYRILRQYECEGYFLDGYIPEINLAIEVDEKPKNTERDIEREKIIKNKLNCEFMRIKDYD